MKNYKIVVARYNEDIEWTKKYDQCLIYNKGKHFDGDYIKLENVGRETHTYLYHIINNYDNLDDYTFFLQGNPFDHSSNLFKNIDELILNNPERNFYWISERIVEGDFEYIREPYFHMFGQLKLAYKFVFGDEPQIETFKFGAGAQFVVSKKNIVSKPLEFYQRLFDFLDKEPLNNNYLRLLRYPDIDQSVININRNCPEICHYMERFWGLIFDEV